MNLEELINSTNLVDGRSQSEVFKKKFGSIYAYNKTVNIAGQGNVIVVNMIIGGVTDMIRLGGKRVPVPFHKVSLAINIGEDYYKVYTADELVATIKAKYPNRANEVDADILEEALKKPTSFFKNSTVFKRAGLGYVVVKNLIPKDCEVQVWCSCSDYYWTFEYYNIHMRNKNGSCLNYAWQATRSYPKTYNYQTKAGKKSTRPMRNPGKHPGMCKHLMMLAAMLLKDKLITEPQKELVRYYEADFKEFTKSRVSQSQFENFMKEYKKGQRELSNQRLRHAQMYGNKAERNFNFKSGKFKWEK